MPLADKRALPTSLPCKADGEMMEPVLELITSYQSRISTVEELITAAYQATVASESSFGVLDKERERLVSSLQKTLAKNCSLRKKDFNCLMEGILAESDRKRKEIEDERTRVREKVTEYLEEQKELAICLRQQLVASVQEKVDSDGLEAVINHIKTAYQDAGQQLFVMLREFRLRLEAFQKEQEETNHRFQRLVDRGESLKTEDLRQLEAAKERQNRIAERAQRRHEVERLLFHFKQQRQNTSRPWRL